MSTYDVNNIKALGDIEGIRKRPGMYIGDLSNPSHLLVETFDNSRDEMHAGHAKECIVSIDTSTNRYSVRDYGRGIPIGKSEFIDITGKVHKIEALQLLVTKTHSGAKFDEGTYKVSSGINGVGMKAVCALSESMVVQTYRDGKSVRITSTKGTIDSLEYLDTSNEPNGLYVEFIGDLDIFESQVIPEDNITSMLGIAKAFGLNVSLVKDSQEVELSQTDIFDLMHKDDESLSEYCRGSFEVESDDKEKFVIAFKYTSETNYLLRGYCNYLPNPGGGSHIKFLEECYKEAWNKYLDPEFKLNDCLLGFRGVGAVFISNQDMSFASQTKERLTTNKSHFNKFRVGIVQEIHKYLDENESIRKGLIKRFKEYRASQNKLLANKELSSLIYINENNSNGVRRKSVVEKLRECTSKSSIDTELYIVEGDSAAGSMIAARDIRTQAILPIRGKILNVAKRNSNLITVMKNAEISSIVNSIGAGIGNGCDATKSRYERILISTDADEDGKNIAALLVSIFVNITPDLVSNGLVHIVESPLYGWKEKGEYVFGDDISDVPKGTDFTRYKGLGEMDPEELHEACMKKSNQKLIQIEYPSNIDEFNKAMTSSQYRFNILDSMGVIKRVN